MSFYEIETNTTQTHDLQPLRLKTTSASVDEISHLVLIDSVNVSAILIYYKLFHYFTLSKVLLKQFNNVMISLKYGFTVWRQKEDFFSII